MASSLPDRRLLAFGLIAFCGLLGEGAMGDWSAVYLDQSLGADVEMAAAAFAVFSLTMALGRFTGDRVVARIGECWRWWAAAARWQPWAWAPRLLIGRPEVAAIVGLGLVGAGLSCVFPVVLSAATRMPGITGRHRDRRHLHDRLSGLPDRPAGDRWCCRAHQPAAGTRHGGAAVP